jgi:cell wall-associated NlpC family hydrolase
MRGPLGISWLAVGAVALSAAACASSGATPKPFPMPGGATPARGGATAPAPPDQASAPPPLTARATATPSHPSMDSYALAGTALGLRGIPYRNGGSDPSGFDCSGFTQYVFAQYGIALPREVREQFRVGKAVKPDDLAVGDIIFFTTTDPGPSHVAIAIGGDEFVHAPSSTGVVRVEHLSSSYWSPRYLGARRVN